MADSGRVRNSKSLSMFVPAILVFAVTVAIGAGLYLHTNRVMGEKIRQEMSTAATLAAMQVPTGDLWTIDEPADASRAVFRDIAGSLNAVRDAVPNARFVYIFRKTDDPKVVEFVVDADAVLSDAELDENKNGAVDEDEAAALPGEKYDVSDQPELQGPAFERVVVTPVYDDKWGPVITALAPVGDGMYAIGIDLDAGEYLRLSQGAFSLAALMLIAFVGVLVAAYVGFYIWRRKIAEEKRVAAIRTNVVRLTMHQLGAPLTGMRWWLDALKEQDAAPSEQKAEAYKNLSASLGRAQDLVNTLQRADDSAGATAVAGSASLPDVFQEVRAELQPILTGKKLDMTVDFGGCGQVRMQPEALKGVLHELLDNAVTYSPNNTAILVRAACDKGQVTVSVSDSGCGIPADELPYVFAEFHRGKDATKYKAVGNGLGLFVTRNVIEAAGGRISVKSEKGMGTTVTFTIAAA